MTGFSYRNLLLQIIPGLVILFAWLLITENGISAAYFKQEDSVVFFLLVLVAFVSGMVIDFVADILESAVIRFYMMPPVYYLLKNGKRCGIVLAHHSFILEELCRLAEQYGKPDKTGVHQSRKSYLEDFNAMKKEKVNYILQVAKNKAFRVCEAYQKDQIDSFFLLYIFFRNMALSLLISSVAVFFLASAMTQSGIMLAMVLFSVAASYRYYLYYARILLGTTVRKEECEDDNKSGQKNQGTDFISPMNQQEDLSTGR